MSEIYKITLTAHTNADGHWYYHSPSGVSLCRGGVIHNIKNLVNARPTRESDVTFHMKRLPDSADGDDVICIKRESFNIDVDDLINVYPDTNLAEEDTPGGMIVYADELTDDLQDFVPEGHSRWHVWVEAEWE